MCLVSLRQSKRTSPAVRLKGSMVGEDSVSDGELGHKGPQLLPWVTEVQESGVYAPWCGCCGEVHVETEWPPILARYDSGKGYWRSCALAQFLLISCLDQVQGRFGVLLTEIGKYKNLTGQVETNEWWGKQELILGLLGENSLYLMSR